MSERWAWIPGFEFEYEVSTNGRVRSYRGSKPRILRPTVDTHGYLMVSLCGRQGPVGGRIQRVHRLVLLAFVGPSDLLTRHLDDNPLNNSLSNLVYGTAAENANDALTHGHNANASKTHCVHGHLFTPENTYRLRGRWRSCRKCNAIAVAEYKRKRANS